MIEYCFTLIVLHNHGNIATEGSPKLELFPTFIERMQGLLIGHTTVDSAAHFIPLNSLNHYICTIWMSIYDPAGIRIQYLYGFEPQPDRMKHRGRPITVLPTVVLMKVGCQPCNYCYENYLLAMRISDDSLLLPHIIKCLGSQQSNT